MLQRFSIINHVSFTYSTPPHCIKKKKTTDKPSHTHTHSRFHPYRTALYATEAFAMVEQHGYGYDHGYDANGKRSLPLLSTSSLLLNPSVRSSKNPLHSSYLLLTPTTTNTLACVWRQGTTKRTFFHVEAHCDWLNPGRNQSVCSEFRKQKHTTNNKPIVRETHTHKRTDRCKQIWCRKKKKGADSQASGNENGKRLGRYNVGRLLSMVWRLLLVVLGFLSSRTC